MDTFEIRSIGRGIGNKEKVLREMDLRYCPVVNALQDSVKAYEECMKLDGHPQGRAIDTWRSIGRHGFVAAAERCIYKNNQSKGFELLVKYGMVDRLYESVIVAYPKVFSAEAVRIARERLATL